jgi:formylglycine-generating enzyme required for sulfatase activity
MPRGVVRLHRPLAVLGACATGVALLAPARDADGAGKCPAGMAYVEPPEDAMGAQAKAPFCIDRWEASLVEHGPHGDAPFSPYDVVGGKKVRAVSKKGVVPQAYVSRDEALAACKASHKRLCVEDEWVTACEGKKPTTFPYGDERRAGYCNDQGTAPLLILYKLEGDAAYGYEPMNDPRLNQVPGTVARTGSHPHCANSYGVYDMVGNLHEWVDDPAGTFRGGYYLDTHINGDGCRYRTVAHDASYHDYSTGFRCCADVRR